jgi:hypothetical protein
MSAENEALQMSTTFDVYPRTKTGAHLRHIDLSVDRGASPLPRINRHSFATSHSCAASAL